MQKQPTFPTPVAVFVPEEIEENETSTAEGCQVEGRRGKKASFIGDQKPSLCERLRTFLKNPVSEDNVTRSFSLKHQVHRWSGYFMDAKMEDRFLKSRLEGRRRGFMALSLVFIFIETLDWGLGAISSYQTDLDIARKCLTFIITLCFLFTGLFFWRSFHHLEKVMAGAIIFWVFCLSMLREEILFGSTSAETQAAVCGTDLFFNEAAIMTLTTAFTVSMIISVPLRRPLLVLTVGSVAVISIVTEFVEGSICGLAKQEVAVLTFFLLCEVVVLGAVMAAVLKEEPAFIPAVRLSVKLQYYLRILLTTIGHQRTRIANLVDERDDLLRSKGGTSSVERLVNLLAEVSRGLRKMENFFLVPVSLMLLPVASKLPQSLAELPEEVEGQLSLSSEAEAHWGLDLRELLGVAVEGRLNGSDREDLEGGMGFVVKIKHPLPIVGVHLLRPLFQDPLQLTAIRKLTNFLTVHFQFMSSLKLRTKGDEFRQCLSRESWLNRMISEQSGKNMEQDVWLVTRGCLKAADLGHSAKPWEIHKKYSFAVTQEFFGQGDLEIAMQLPVSPLCSREGASPESLCKSQSGFLSFVCKELFVELSLIEQMARTGSGARDAGGGESSRCAPMHSPTSLCDEAESAGSCSRIAAVCVRHLNENVSRWNDTASTAALVPVGRSAYLFEEPQDKATLLASHPAVAPRGRDGGTATRTSMVSEELRTPLLSPGKEKGRTFFFDQETGERTGKPR
uniref:PDEase domain-containing protein n=1 Tax=Chromera velia CCMP2878 TaxID=1169474 RepID=A0A0G4HDI7_9ALVE|eukprot:Cvel_26311.t1-p1 / transcript=Cvel_26311.t1 / gene=Cvel_26311 / organism=Chromera_velia_CCMP2878 / gene_product=Probable 3',5'-cyclic phosphodiesterase pde-1, putative / transcript_product=Probable 3',5'-cyclic phosphodiesterase pde-1, putative / location=Cvel_scaffold3108:4260-12475(-) / protein_length=733 / sequence_SO=supercontig / SO=protein_coding / is_pseudo=false